MRAIRVEFITRLYFAGAISPASARAVIDQQIVSTQAGLTQLQTLLDELPPEQTFNRLGLDFRVQQLTSVLVWLGTCKAQLNFTR
jgi:hypothetical protein